MPKAQRRRVAAAASSARPRAARGKSRAARRPSAAQRSTRAHLGRGVPSYVTLYLSRLTKLADTIERYFGEPFIQGPTWARNQAIHWRKRFEQYLTVVPAGAERYTVPIKARVDALPWDTPAEST